MTYSPIDFSLSTIVAVGFLAQVGTFLAQKALPFVGRTLFGAGGAVGAGQVVSRAIAPVSRALVPAFRGIARSPAGRAAALGAGFGTGQAIAERGLKITIDRRTGQQVLVRRRRMRPTNIRALRRAIRRVRGFQRVTRKVNRLFPRQRIIFGGRARRRRGRGDILSDEFFTEDLADVLDEAEDLGIGKFRDEESGGEED